MRSELRIRLRPLRWFVSRPSQRRGGLRSVRDAVRARATLRSRSLPSHVQPGSRRLRQHLPRPCDGPRKLRNVRSDVRRGPALLWKRVQRHVRRGHGELQWVVS